MTQLLALLLAAPLALAQTLPVTQSAADLSRYGQDPATLAYVAAARAHLGDCGGSVLYQDLDRGSVLILEIICLEGDEPRLARLTFTRAGARLVPFRSEFLP